MSEHYHVAWLHVATRGKMLSGPISLEQAEHLVEHGHWYEQTQTIEKCDGECKSPKRGKQGAAR